MNELGTIEQIELNALVTCLYQCSGYDFRSYSQPSLLRNLYREVENRHLNSISELIPLILHDPAKRIDLVQNLSINVTEFFRDPTIFATLVNNVFPVLRSFPFIKIWVAGCATGNEVYSLAILLQEHGLLERTLIYATDFNHKVLSKAKEGVFHSNELEAAEQNYFNAGGTCQLNDYFHNGYGMAKIQESIRKRITFAHHNLATDNVFGEMQLIICKNVLIYFNKNLKQRVIQLFYNSLHYGGFLALGTTESLDFLGRQEHFFEIQKFQHIYKKMSEQSGVVIAERGVLL